eukprot:TCONS_00068552-protein
MGDNLNGLRKYLEKYATLAENRTRNIDIVGNEFQEIRNIAADLKKLLPANEGAKDVNRKKNRYKDIIPYDVSRVKVEVTSFEDGADYINANIIKDHVKKVCYIASQGPMPQTVVEFWRMIWGYQVKLIIMACREIEMGKARCQRYWPSKSEEVYGDVSVTLLKETSVAKNVILRELCATRKGTKRKLYQLHYMDWPDHGAPETFEVILHLLKIARKIQPNDENPLLVHCSAGCGRTGAIIAIDYARKLIEARANNISIFDIVKHLRQQRPSMVQTKEQYEFIYEVVRELVLKELKACDEEFENCSPDATYENIQFILKEKNYNRSKSAEKTIEDSNSHISRSKSAEDVCSKPSTPSQQRRQIVLPTEHAINTGGSFRRSRSQNRRSPNVPSAAGSRPPLPRKGSESTDKAYSPKKKDTEACKQTPSKPLSSSTGAIQLRSQFEYENIHPPPTAAHSKPRSTSSEPMSPFADEEYIPVAKPVGLTSYPIKTAMLNVSAIEHQHRPIKQTRSHERIPQSSIPPSTISNINQERMKKSSSANDICNDLKESRGGGGKQKDSKASPIDALYTPVEKSKKIAPPSTNPPNEDSLYTQVDKLKKPAPYHSSHDKVIHKPAAPMILGSAVERNRSSVKKTIMQDKASEIKKADKWQISVESSTTSTSPTGGDAPPLPERTPESFIIIDDKADTQRNQQPLIKSSVLNSSSAKPGSKGGRDVSPEEYTPVASLQSSTSQPTPQENKPSSWNPLSKMMNKNKTNDERNSPAETKKSNSLPPLSSLGFGKRLKKKPQGPREMPLHFH